MAYILVDNGNIAAKKLAPGTKVRYNQDGTISGQARYTIQKANAISGLPAIGTAHPYAGNTYVSDREITWNESEAEYLLEYMGVWSTTVQKVEGIASTENVPIDLNPHFWDDLAYNPVYPKDDSHLGYSMDASGNYTDWFPTTDAGAGAAFDDAHTFLGFIPGATSRTGGNLGGVVSFISPAGLTVRISYAASSASTVTSALAKLGGLYSSLVAGSVTISQSNSILCTSVNWEEIYMQTYSVFRISEEYLFNPLGFNSDVYQL